MRDFPSSPRSDTLIVLFFVLTLGSWCSISPAIRDDDCCVQRERADIDALRKILWLYQPLSCSTRPLPRPGSREATSASLQHQQPAMGVVAGCCPPRFS